MARPSLQKIFEYCLGSGKRRGHAIKLRWNMWDTTSRRHVRRPLEHGEWNDTNDGTDNKRARSLALA